jgi:hypothetical protein
MVQAIHGAALALAVALAPAAARADRDGGAQANGLHDVTVAGAGGGHRLAGTLDIQRFEAVDGNVVAVGLLRGTLTDRAGNLASFAEQAVAIPLATGGDHDRGSRDARSTRRMGGLRALVVPAQVKTVCTVLDLQLVPADLNLLGLVVTTGPIVVRIGANPGPGNLLGNLLCTVLGLLDNFTAASAGALANTLNQVLAAA